jgi:hypothetical protein
VRESKFRKSWLVPRHPTATAALSTYAAQRDGRLGPCQSGGFFRTDRAPVLKPNTVERTFARLREQGSGIASPAVLPDWVGPSTSTEWPGSAASSRPCVPCPRVSRPGTGRRTARVRRSRRVAHRAAVGSPVVCRVVRQAATRASPTTASPTSAAKTVQNATGPGSCEASSGKRHYPAILPPGPKQALDQSAIARPGGTSLRRYSHPDAGQCLVRGRPFPRRRCESLLSRRGDAFLWGVRSSATCQHRATRTGPAPPPRRCPVRAVARACPRTVGESHR